MESKEVFETPSPDTEFEFMPEEVIEVGGTTVIFREPTEQQLPTSNVTRADGGIIGQNYFDSSNEWTATVIGESPRGAALQVTKRPNGVGYTISYRDGGNVPNDLSGWFTTYDKAEVAARAYLAGLWDQARKEG